MLAPSRVVWLGIPLAAFAVTGLSGVDFGLPAVLWLTRLLAVPF